VDFGNLRITRVLGETDGGDVLGGADSALGAADCGNASRALGAADSGNASTVLGGNESKALGEAEGCNELREPEGGNESKALGKADGDIESTEVGEGVGPNTVNVMIIPASQCDPISQANVISSPASLLWKV
jgi:hypothetical protein